MKPKIITDKELPIIEDVLTKWSGKLTWPAFAQAIADRIGRKSISQFTLMGDEGIKQAFKRRKQTLKQAKVNLNSESEYVTVDALSLEIEALRNQIFHLKSEHGIKKRIYEENFIRWQYNLSNMSGVDMSKLDAPLPATNRDG